MVKWLRKGLLVLQPIVTICAISYFVLSIIEPNKELELLYRLNGGVYLIISTLVIPKVTED